MIMKQEMLCQHCAADTRKLFPTDNPYPGEHVKFVPGKARTWLRCDSCGEGLSTDTVCTAFSVWADYGGIPYYPWEKDFINPATPG